MLERLYLKNFRRHLETEIHFSTESQIIAITGSNGQGKSTLLEGILWCLYGESRHGRRNLGSLVRRGAEQMGLHAELEFSLGNDKYKIERRWYKGKHTANLYTNNNLGARTADEVTKAVSVILGMDAVGFKLATIAKQKELDGLADLTPAARRKTIARLLRLDAVGKAQVAARELYRSNKVKADMLTEYTDLDSENKALEEAQAEVDELAQNVQECVDALKAINEELSAMSDVEADYLEKRTQLARTQALLESARTGLTRLAAEHDTIVIPERITKPAVELTEVVAKLDEVKELIARGQAVKPLKEQQLSSQRHLTQAVKQLEQLPVVDIDELERAYASLTTNVEVSVNEENNLRAEIETLVTANSAQLFEVKQLKQKIAHTHSLGAQCDSCGQGIDEQHKEKQADDLSSALLQAQAQEQASSEELISLRKKLEETVAHIKDVRKQLHEAQQNLNEARNNENNRADLQRRITTLTKELERLDETIVDVDLEEAYAQRAELEEIYAQHDRWKVNENARGERIQRQRDLEQRMAALKAEEKNLKTQVEQAQIPQDLVDAYERRSTLARNKDAENQVYTVLLAEHASAQTRVSNHTARVREASERSNKAAVLRKEAEVAAKTASLLEDVSAKMATQIRPELEGWVSEKLQSMSNGRFSAVRISNDYDVTVADHDGVFYPISEFSGGEADLIALAIRLGLAQVVAGRGGNNSGRFLILDEVFGSQDEGRRRAILDALRKLRGTYGQILLISHVGGIEDSADVVIEVNRDEAEEQAKVSIS